MSKDRYWRAISIDIISPEHFLNVALFLMTGGNYVLYKTPGREFTVDDYRRLERTNTEFLYVRSGDMESINEYMESGLADMLTRNDLSGYAKGRILYQTSVNCLIDMFESPETTANQIRCRNMVQHIIQQVSTDPHALNSLKSIVGHNFYIFTHSVQVTALSLLVHSELFTMAHDEMVDIGTGSLLHDYGMTFITSELLDKNDALSEVEYHKVKQHTQQGYEYFKHSGNYSEIVLNIVRYHHERYDGDGYPTGIKGDEIPRSGQVAAICDVYSALTMDRPQRKANTHANAVKVMREEGQNGAFNLNLLNSFLEIIDESNSG